MVKRIRRTKGRSTKRWSSTKKGQRHAWRKAHPGWTYNYKNWRYFNRRGEQAYGYNFRKFSELPYWRRTYDGNRYIIKDWQPAQHQYIWGSKTVGRTVPQFRQPQVVDTSRGRIQGAPVGPQRTYDVWYNQPELPYQYRNKDWNTYQPIDIPWPWKDRAKTPEVWKPVQGKPDYVTHRRGGFDYYMRRNTGKIEFVIPRWSLPLWQQIPGGREIPRGSGWPTWANIAEKILRQTMGPRQPTDRESQSSKPCYHYIWINGKKRKVPCSQTFSPVRRKSTKGYGYYPRKAYSRRQRYYP